MKHDQYGSRIPEDLVILDLEPDDLSEAEVDLVLKADWYILRDNPTSYLILVSYKAIEGLTETDPTDAAIDRHTQFDLCNDVLKRADIRGGLRFYHA